MARFRDRMDRDHPGWDTAAITGRINLYYFTGTIQDGLLFIPRDGDAVFWVKKSSSGQDRNRRFWISGR